MWLAARCWCCCAALLLLLVGSGCSNAMCGSCGEVDATPPTVVASSPVAAASGVSLGAVVSVTFSEPVEPGSLAAGGLLLLDGASQAVAGVVAVSGAGATFTPTSPLRAATTYTATVSAAVRDQAGNHLAAPFAWSFTTVPPPDTTPPTVLATSPADGAADVPASAAVTVTLSEPVAAASAPGALTLAATGGAAMAGTIQVSGATVTFTPASPLALGATYAAALAATVTDLAGNPLGAPLAWTFATAAAPDTTPPWLTGSGPTGGSTGLSLKTTVWVSFSEPMDPVTTGGALRLLDGAGLAVPASVLVIGDTATLTPTGLLAYLTTYTAHLSGAATDLAGNHFPADDMSFTFTTKARDAFDDAFGEGGFATARVGRSAGASALASQADGAVVVAGGTVDPLLGSLDVLLARFTPDGRLDASFGQGGLVTWDGGAVTAGNPLFRSDGARAVAVQADGRILVAGTSWQAQGASSGLPGNDLLLLRYLPDGTLDPDFAAGGVLLHDSGADDSLGGLALQADQRMVVAGTSCLGATCDGRLLRFDAHGALDPTFGTAGQVTMADCAPVGLVVQPADQRLVVGCRATGVANIHFEVRRFDGDGAPDDTFGTAGVAALPARDTGDFLEAVALAPDGAVLASGSSGVAGGGAGSAMVVRFTPAGALDLAFGSGGVALPASGSQGLAVRPDGRVVLGGAGLRQLTATGAPDLTFGAGGVVTLTGAGLGGGVSALLVSADGKVVFAGQTAAWAYQQTDLLVGRQRP